MWYHGISRMAQLSHVDRLMSLHLLALGLSGFSGILVSWVHFSSHNQELFRPSLVGLVSTWHVGSWVYLHNGIHSGVSCDRRVSGSMCFNKSQPDHLIILTLIGTNYFISWFLTQGITLNLHTAAKQPIKPEYFTAACEVETANYHITGN